MGAEIRTLQKRVEGRLEELRKMCAKDSRAYEVATETCLKDLAAAIDRLTWAHDNRTATNVRLTRCREQLRDCQIEFKRLAKERSASHELTQLVGNAQSRSAYAKSEEEGLLRERSQVELTNQNLDDLLAHIGDTHVAIERQNQRFVEMRSRMSYIRGMLPDVNVLIGKIGTRKRFESIVLTATTGFCVFVILWYKLLLQV